MKLSIVIYRFSFLIVKGHINEFIGLLLRVNS